MNLTDLAISLGADKSYVSRSFSSPPNWQIDKIADFADALGVELNIVARDVRTGEFFTPSGRIHFANSTTETGNFQHLITAHQHTLAKTEAKPVVMVMA